MQLRAARQRALEAAELVALPKERLQAMLRPVLVLRVALLVEVPVSVRQVALLAVVLALVRRVRLPAVALPAELLLPRPRPHP